MPKALFVHLIGIVVDRYCHFANLSEPGTGVFTLKGDGIKGVKVINALGEVVYESNKVQRLTSANMQKDVFSADDY